MPLDPKKHITNIKGNDFVKYEGLLHVAHTDCKLMALTTEFVPELSDVTQQRFVFKATAINESGQEFVEYGDADPSNVDKMVVRHVMRIALTRAKARALRDLTNIGMTSADEVTRDDLKDDHEPLPVRNQTKKQTAPTAPAKKQAPAKQEPKENKPVAKPKGDFKFDDVPKTGNVHDLRSTLETSLKKSLVDKLGLMVEKHNLNDWLPSALQHYNKEQINHLTIDELEECITKVEAWQAKKEAKKEATG